MTTSLHIWLIYLFVLNARNICTTISNRFVGHRIKTKTGSRVFLYIWPSLNWAALVRDMLFNLGFGYAWMQQGVTNRTYFISLFKQRLRDQYIQQWFTSVSTRSSCSIYKNITNHFRCQNYFHMVTNCKYRISFIRFRTKNHSLPNVIQGRGRNRRPYNERLCPTCNVLGDEFHCFFECEITRHIRHVLPRYYTFRPNMFKFSSLLSFEEPSVLRKHAIFLYIRDS